MSSKIIETLKTQLMCNIKYMKNIFVYFKLLLLCVINKASLFSCK